MKTYLFDTNAWLRFLLNDVPSQADAVSDLINEAKSGNIRIIVSVLAVWELVFALTKYYGFSRPDVAEKLTRLLRLSYLSMEERDVILDVLKVYGTSPLAFADIYFAIISKKNGYTLFTFDKKLARAAKSRLVA